MADDAADSAAAKACLEAHRCSEQTLLSKMLPPPGVFGESRWFDQLLEGARQSAFRDGMGAWEVIGYLNRRGYGYLVDDESFATARKAAPAACPEVQANWLIQWKRAEVWLAALRDTKSPAAISTLLAQFQAREQTLSEELLAALIWVALEAASTAAFDEERNNQSVERIGTTKNLWVNQAWPCIATCLAENLVRTEAGENIAVDMLTLCQVARDAPKHSRVRWHWHVALAEQLPERAFNGLIGRLENRGQAFRFSILEGAALVAVAQLPKRTGWVEKVVNAYSALPLEEWKGRGGRQPNSQHSGKPPSLMGACLAAQPLPTDVWKIIWEQSNPGPSDGWPVDFANWDEKRASSVHWEWVGLCACLGLDNSEKPAQIKNLSLFEAVKDRLHQRLLDAAGEYQEMDSAVLHVLWAIGGERVMERSKSVLSDFWVEQQTWAFRKSSVSIKALKNTG